MTQGNREYSPAASQAMYAALENILQNVKGNPLIDEFYRVLIVARCEQALAKARGEE